MLKETMPANAIIEVQRCKDIGERIHNGFRKKAILKLKYVYILGNGNVDQEKKRAWDIIHVLDT